MTDEKSPPTAEEGRERRCPRLGGQVPFTYCRTGDGGRTCFKIFDCWWEIFDVVEYLRKTLPPMEFSRVMEHRQKPKIWSILEEVEAAKRRAVKREADKAPPPDRDER